LGIVFNGTTASSMTFVDVRYGGSSGTSDGNAMVAVNGGSVTIEDSTFMNSSVSGLLVYGGSTGSGASATIRRTEFATNGFVGTALHGSGMFVNNAPVTVEDSAFWSNATDGVRFNMTSGYSAAASQLSGSSFWSNARWGVNIGNTTGASLPLAPDGNVSGKPANDVYDNGSFGFTQAETWVQLTISQATLASDWSGTYWGPTTTQACGLGTGNSHLSYGAPDPNPSTTLPVDRGPVSHSLAHSGASWCGNDDVTDDPPASTQPSLYFNPPPPDFGGLLGPQTFGCLPCLIRSEEVALGLVAPAGSPVTYTQNPVEPATGSLTEMATDLEMSGPGIPFAWTRSYNSQDSYSGPLGPGWVVPFSASLTVVNPTTGQLEYRSGSGQRTQLIKTSGGGTGSATYAGKGLDATVVRLSGGGYQITMRDQRVFSFDSSGVLTSIKPRFGPATTLNYTSGKLTSITDSAGRTVTITYSGSSPTLIDSVTLPDGRYVQYGYTAGMLTSVRDARGKTWTIAYNGSGLLVSILDPTGNYKLQNVVYDGSGRVTSEQDGAGNATTYAYTTSSPWAVTTVTPPGRGAITYRQRGNMLFSVTDALGRTTSYTYDAMGRRSSVTDGRGNTTLFSSDARGNLIRTVGPAPSSVTTSATYNATNDVTSQTDGRGNATTYAYATVSDPAADYQVGQLKSITDREAGVTTLKYWTTTSSPAPPATNVGLVKSSQDARGKTTLFDYDSSGDLATITSPLGNKTTYTYDSSGRMSSLRDPRGNVPVPPSGYLTQWTYDENDHVLTSTDALGNVTTSTYLDNGLLHTTVRLDVGGTPRTTTYDYDSTNRLWKTTTPAGGVTTRLYWSDGLLKSVQSPTGNLTSYDYDTAGQLATMVEPDGNASGGTPSDYTWTYGYDNSGNQTSAAHPDGGTSQVAYDELDRPDLWTDALGHTTSATYDADDNVTSRSDGLSHVTSYTYDKENRVLTSKDPNGQTSGKTTTYTYFATGQVQSSTTPLGNETTYTLDDDGRVATMVEPRGNVSGGTPSQYTWTYTYDEDANRTRVTDPLGNYTQYGWDAVNDLTSVTDQDGNTTSFAYDPMNRIQTVTPPAAGATGSLDTTYTYDADSNLSSRTDPNSHATTWTYATDERASSQTTPVGTTNYTYDPNGNLTSIETPAGTSTPTTGDGTITDAYDRMGRLTSTTYSDSTPTVTRTYDSAGRPATMVDQAGTVTYTYDNADRLTDIVRTGGGAGLNGTLHYAYDAANNITSRTLPDGTVTTIGFDDDEQPTSHTTGSATTTVGYDAAGNITSVALPTGNGYTETRTFDRAGRLTGVNNAKSGTSLSQFTWTLDPAGNPTKQSTLRNSVITTELYTYDARNRITSDCWGVSSLATNCTGAPATITYAYDKADNRTSEGRTGTLSNPGTITSTYNAADQLTQTVEGTTTTNYTYDANGNQATAGATSFTYDLANRATSATTASVTTTYAYDGDNNRIQSTTPSGADLRYIWDPLAETGIPEIALEQTPSGSLVRRYTQTPIGADSMTTPAGAFYYSHDPRGDVSDVTDASGAAQWLYDYDPYGAPRTTTNVTGTAPENRLQYNSQYQDPETSLYNLRARLYNPNTGLFQAVDPSPQAARTPAFGTYDYTEDNPLTRSDPLGLCDHWYDVGCELGNAVNGIGILEDPSQSVKTTAVLGGDPLGTQPGDRWTPQEHEVASAAEPYYQTMKGVNPLMSAGFNCGSVASGSTSSMQWVACIAGMAAAATLDPAASEAAAAACPLEAVTEESGVAASGVDTSVAEGETAATNGETAATKAGREMHNTWDYGPGFQKEFRLPSGQRVDAMNRVTRQIIELKPNNPRAIRLGERQLQRYLDELNREYPGPTPWTGKVVTY
jgi:RHS repeat-associated protein